MRFLLLSFIIHLGVLTSATAVDFTELSRSTPITTTYEAKTKCYVDVSLFLNARKASTESAYLRVMYIIGEDTLNDNLWVQGEINRVVKQLFLDEGERITAKLYLNNSELDILSGIDGSFNVIRNLNFDPSTDQGKNTFVGNVWSIDQTPLFRVTLDEGTDKIFRLKIGLDENFEFDKLYVKLKVISPTEGIIMVDKSIDVTTEEVLNQRRKIYSIDISEVSLTKAGSYYFQVIHNMTGKRINGVENVEYELVAE